MKKLIIIGDGGHSKVVQSIVKKSNQFKLIEIWDDKYAVSHTKDDVLYCSVVKNSSACQDESVYFFIAIGDNHVRKQFVNLLNIDDDRYAIISASSALISDDVTIKAGSLVMAGAIIQTNVTVANQTIVNSGSIIEHDTTVQDFVHIAPGVTITGHCTIDSGSLIGAGSVLLPNISIGTEAIIGAGSVVTKNVLAKQTVCGCPARCIRTD